MFLIFQSIFEKSIHVPSQKTIHPSIIDAKARNQLLIVIAFIAVPSIIMAIITAKSATEVPSLNKLSHSKISASLLGAPTLLNMLRTATGSVALMSAAKSKQTKNGICSQKSASI